MSEDNIPSNVSEIHDLEDTQIIRNTLISLTPTDLPSKNITDIEEIENNTTRINCANSILENVAKTMSQNKSSMSDPGKLMGLFDVISRQMTEAVKKDLGEDDAEKMDKLSHIGKNIFSNMMNEQSSKEHKIKTYIENLLKTEDMETSLILAQEEFDLEDGFVLNTTLNVPVIINFPHSIKVKTGGTVKLDSY